MTTIDTPGGPPAKILVTDLPNGKRVRTYFLCSKKETPTTQKGSTYLRATFRDASGELTGINWEPDTVLLGSFGEGDVVEVEGKFKIHDKYGPQLYVDSGRRLDEGEYDPSTLVAVSPVPTGDLDVRVRALLAAVRDPAVRALLERALDPAHEPGATFAVVPAAIRNHHAYRHGLLEHSVIVAETGLRVTEAFDSVDADLVIAGGLLHDIGKTRAYSADPMATGLTDDGYLLGEIVSGLDIIHDLIDETPGLSDEKARLLQHIVAAHHGEREKGSPVVPQIREAVIVHYCDDMTARVAAIDEAKRQVPEGTVWTPQRVGMLGVNAYLGRTDDARAEEPTGGPAPVAADAPSAPQGPAGTTDAALATAALLVPHSASAPEADDAPPLDEDFGFGDDAEDDSDPGGGSGGDDPGDPGDASGGDDPGDPGDEQLFSIDT
jgi:3'-5' exoribonuclease